MCSEITRRWIEAGKLIAEDVNSQVLCPVCQVEMLKVLDVNNATSPSHLERHMSCSHCGAYNSLRLARSS
jgi:hypothetical protein